MKANFKFLALILLCSLLLLNYCGGGSSGGSGGPDIYAAGSCKNGSTYVAGYWKNGAWTKLDNAYGDYNAEVISFVIDGDDIYAGGYSRNSTGVDIAGFWKNGTWTGFTNGYGTNAACVMTIAVDNGTVYAGGYCTDSGDNSMAGYWTTTTSGTTWTELSNTSLANSAYVDGIALNESGDVYAGGYYNPTGSPIKPCYWKNNYSGRKEFTNEYGAYPALAYTIALDGSDVYTGGGCVIDDDYNETAGYWKTTTDSTTWTELDNYYGGPWAEVNTLTIDGSNVYAGGYSCNSATPTVTYAGYWKNGTWEECTNSYDSTGAYVRDIVIDGSDVYAAGNCKNGSYYTGGYWKNGTWKELTNSYGAYESTVAAIVVK